MNTNEHGFKHGEITQRIIGVFYEVYNDLGHGFLESVYQKSLGLALDSVGLEVGLLLNFGLKPEFTRLLFDNPRKTTRETRELSVASLLVPDD